MTGKHLFGLTLVGLLTFVAGCERSPEDVEKWRNAQRGMEKMQEWATSSKEPTDVRVRALQVIIEENNPTLIDTTLEKVEDEKARKKLVAGAVETVTELWEKGEPPTLPDEKKKKGGRVQLKEDAPATVAKDSAYYLIPFTEGENKKKLQKILTQWLEADWKLRNEAGKITLGQALSRAGEGGLDNALNWLRETDDFYQVASQLREYANKKQKKEIAKIIKKRAEKAHPKLSDSLLAAVVNTRQEVMVPYFKKVISDPKSDPKMVDQCMEALKKTAGPKATKFFSKMIRDRPGTLRWAAVNDLIKIRGKAGILTAASSLPLTKKQYEKQAKNGKTLRENAGWFASFTLDEMISTDVSSVANVLVRALESERWPVRVMGLMTAARAHTCATKAGECGDSSKKEDLLGKNRKKVLKAVEKLTSSDESIPAWGEDKTIGDLATDIANGMKE